MQEPIKAAYETIDFLSQHHAILGGRLRSSINKHGRQISVWIEADQIVSGVKRKNVHLRNPATGDDIIGRSSIENGCIDPAFTQACEEMLMGLFVAMREHAMLLETDRPTWGRNYTLASVNSPSIT